MSRQLNDRAMRFTLYITICTMMAVAASTTMSYAADNNTVARASWEAGVVAYNNKEYDKAVEAFENIVANDYASADVYYNLANAYFKLGQQAATSRPFAGGELGHAVLNYERALKLDPTMDDARYNLDIAKDMTNDTEAVPESFLAMVWQAMARAMTSNGWVVLSLSSLFATAIFVLLYLLHGAIVVRKVAFFVSLVTLLIFIVATSLSIAQLRAAENRSRAVILTNDTTPVHASPDSSSKIIRQPSQGVTVELEREQGEWTEVCFADGEKGWVRSTALEVI